MAEKQKRKFFLFLVLGSIFTVFMFYCYPSVVKYMFYHLTQKQKYIFMYNFFYRIVTLGFILTSFSIIIFALFRHIKIIKKLSIIMLLIGFFILSTFLFFKPVNDRIGFLKAKNGVNFYIGFHIKDKTFFIKKEFIKTGK